MTMRSPDPKSCTSTSTCSPRRSPRLYHKYVKPGALAKLRDSKITARRTSQISLSEMLLLTPTSPSSPTIQQEYQPLNQDTGVPCFTSPVSLNRPGCLRRKKLFAVTPSFTPTDTYEF
ncbi:hypothetical protein E2542_SST20631 [Spatholobus suberectus]|nr:hypothetical protein E2542_SST30675 [Spatholobus suberectus]TKY56190.1 hypothetical protein E2542_SST20631 [Spatholobus suberectus]